MRLAGHRFVTVLSLAALVAHPVCAAAIPDAVPADPGTTIVDRLVESGTAPGEATAQSAQLTAEDRAVLAAHPEMLQRAGADTGGPEHVAAELAAIGTAAGTASAQAHRLTPEDIAVLLRHPEMLQRAGAMSETSQALLIGALIVAGIVVLAAASNSSGGFLFIN